MVRASSFFSLFSLCYLLSLSLFLEIARSNEGGPIRELDVKLNNKIEEDYVAPAYIAFSGAANTLRAESSSSNEAFVFSTDILNGVPVPVLNVSQPTINIQLKTSDNKKLKLR
jgi:hypothetical protein